MFPPPMMCDWARSLLAQEAVADTASVQTEPMTLRVFGRLRQQLCVPIGIDGFQLLASRALALAKSESPRLSAVQVTADGWLNGLAGVESQPDIDQDGKVGVILLAQLLWLFLTFLGEATTLRLMENVRLSDAVGAESGTAGSAATGTGTDQAFESLLQQVDRLKSVSEDLGSLADKLPGMEDGLVSVAENLRNIATVLDVFALIRSKSKGLQEDVSQQPPTRYVM
jgi:hypothetical protein